MVVAEAAAQLVDPGGPTRGVEEEAAAGDVVVAAASPDVLDAQPDPVVLPGSPVVHSAVEVQHKVDSAPHVAGHIACPAETIEHVRPGPPVEHVVRRVPDQLVVASPTVDVLHGCADVVVLPGGPIVGDAVGIDHEVRGAGLVCDEIAAAVPAVDSVVVAEDDRPRLCRTRSRIEGVVAAKAAERVVPEPTRERVRATVACERVVTGAADEVLDSGIGVAGPVVRVVRDRGHVAAAVREVEGVVAGAPVRLGPVERLARPQDVVSGIPEEIVCGVVGRHHGVVTVAAVHVVDVAAGADRVIPGVAEDGGDYVRGHARLVVHIAQPHRGVRSAREVAERAAADVVVADLITGRVLVPRRVLDHVGRKHDHGTGILDVVGAREGPRGVGADIEVVHLAGGGGVGEVLVDAAAAVDRVAAAHVHSRSARQAGPQRAEREACEKHQKGASPAYEMGHHGRRRRADPEPFNPTPASRVSPAAPQATSTHRSGSAPSSLVTSPPSSRWFR